jgi:hypothetical protein
MLAGKRQEPIRMDVETECNPDRQQPVACRIREDVEEVALPT